jgi:hypothetical protein
MGRRPYTEEERLAAYQLRLDRARKHSAMMREKDPELCKQRVRASYEKHPDHYKTLIAESARKYYRRKKEEKQAEMQAQPILSGV